MKKMTKLEAMVKIQALNMQLPPEVPGERHLAHYLEQIIVALEPLADHAPVDEIASQLLFKWTDLFTYEKNDDKNLQGLPELMLAMGAHLFHTETQTVKSKPITISTITKLPKWPSTENDDDKAEGTPLTEIGKNPYFFRMFLVPYLNQHENARVFKLLAETENPEAIYTEYLTGNKRDKEKLVQNFKKAIDENNPHLISERLAFTSGRQTLLSHVLQIGGSSNTIKHTSHFDTYCRLNEHYKITEKNLAQLMSNETRLANTPGLAQPTVDRRALTDSEHHLLSQCMAKHLKEKNWGQIEYLINIGAPTTALTHQLKNTTEEVLFRAKESERREAIETIKKMIALGADAFTTMHLVVSKLTQQSTDCLSDVIQALFSINPYELNHLSNTEDKIKNPLLIALLLSNATHPSRKNLRVFYRQQIETVTQTKPLLATLYCAAQTKTHRRFFGLTQATFEGVFLTETNEPLSFIPPLFEAMNSFFRYISVTDFKNTLVKAILALSPDAKLKLRTMIDDKKTCLAVVLLKTRQHKGTQKNTAHFNELMEKLTPTSSDYLNYDSSDDEAEKAEACFEPTDNQEEAIRIFKNLTPALQKPVEFYLHLLNKRFDLASAIVRSGHFDVNETVNWIQQNISGVSLNYAAGNIALKLWSDTRPPITTTLEEKITLTQFLIEHGLSIFSLLDALKGLEVTGTDDSQKQLKRFIEEAHQNGTLDAYFHKIPASHLTSVFSNYQQQAELRTLPQCNDPSPITSLILYQLPNKWSLPEISADALKKHFMQALSEAQKLGLTHLLKALAGKRDSALPLIQKKIASCISSSSELITEFKKLKENKTTCALFMILKYQPTHYIPLFHEDRIKNISPYSASHYTLFKQTHFPKPVPAEVQARDKANKVTT
jgi:hypothetical protein